MDENLPNPQGDTQNVVPMGQPATPPVSPTPATPPAPPSSILTPPVPEQPAPKTNLMLWISLGILALAAIAGGAFYFLKGTSSRPAPTPLPTAFKPVPTPTDRTAGWLTYSNTKYNFSFKYRPDAKIQEQTDGTINLTLLGLNVAFKPGSLGGLTLKALVDQKIKAFSAQGTVSATASATIAALSGYKFHLETIAPSDYYYLPLGTTSYLEIGNFTRDPSGAGFTQNVQDTLSSITYGVASPSASPLSTPSATFTP